VSDWDRRYLALAEFISGWSKDPSTKVGAVITDSNNRVISIGFNGLPRGMEDTTERLENRELKYKLMVHAERNAIIFAERPLHGCTLYTWPFMPCSVCAGIVSQAGIRRVVAPFSDNPRWQDDFKLTKEMFAETGVALTLK
jgi:dCMP deaminase